MHFKANLLPEFFLFSPFFFTSIETSDYHLETRLFEYIDRNGMATLFTINNVSIF